MTHTRRMRLNSAQHAPQPHHQPWCGLSRGHIGHRLSTSSTPRRAASHCCSSRRRPPCSTKIVAKSSLPRVLMVQPPFPVDNSPLCTIQVQQIVTRSGLNRWRSAGPIREVPGWPECLSGWLLHAGASGDRHLRTLRCQECATSDLTCRNAGTERAARAGKLARKVARKVEQNLRNERRYAATQSKFPFTHK